MRRVLGENITARLVLTFVISWLNYCNAILTGLPQSRMAPFQRVQNSAVRMVKRLGSRYHITESQRNMHRLPIQYRVIYKAVHHNAYGPHRLRSGLHLRTRISTSALPGRSRLRSSGGNRYEIYVIHDKIGERAFSYAVPAAWKSLPTIIINLTDTQTFKYSLKTYLFKLAYNLWFLHVQRFWSQGGDVLHIVFWV